MATLIVSVVAALVEGFFLYQQHRAAAAAKIHSDQLLNRFLQGDTTHVTGGTGVSIRLQNVRFKWSENVYIDAGDMAMKAMPLEGTTVNFDDLESFRLRLQRSVVRIRPEVLQGMFNESVFNYPGSKVRDLTVTLVESGGERLVRLNGKLNMVGWIPFSMFSRLSIDHRTNTLAIDVDHLKVFGLPATKLLKLKPLNLESLIALPPNNSLMVHGNRLMVKPFGLFPPPRIDGTMSNIVLEPNVVRLEFSGPAISAPEYPAKNYVYLHGGTSQFGHFRMLDTHVLVLDRDQRTPFAFSIPRYAAAIPRSNIEVHDTRSVQVVMPDM
jgi:hypothetical protein